MPQPLIIFTRHVISRLQERQLSENWIRQSLFQPDKKQKGKHPGTTEFVKRFGTSTVTVIAKRKFSGEWIVISAWVDPPVAGTKDARRKQNYLFYKRSGFWKKLWLQFLRKLGIFPF